MRPQIVDSIRPRVQLCVFGSEMGRTWSSSSPTLWMYQSRRMCRNVFKHSRSVVASPCKPSGRCVRIGPQWADQPQNASALNRSTVDRFTTTALNGRTATKQHWYRTIPMLFPHSLHLELSVGALGSSAGLCEPKGREIPDQQHDKALNAKTPGVGAPRVSAN